MTLMVTIDDAKKDISNLLERVKKHSVEIIIAENGQPIARIVPTERETAAIGPCRVPGIDKGLFVVPDDFNDPLPPEIEDLWYQ